VLPSVCAERSRAAEAGRVPLRPTPGSRAPQDVSEEAETDSEEGEEPCVVERS